MKKSFSLGFRLLQFFIGIALTGSSVMAGPGARVGIRFDLIDIYSQSELSGDERYKAPEDFSIVKLEGQIPSLLPRWNMVKAPRTKDDISGSSGVTGKTFLVGSQLLFVYDGKSKTPSEILESDKVIRLAELTHQVEYPFDFDGFKTTLVRPMFFDAGVALEADGSIRVSDTVDYLAELNRSSIRAKIENHMKAEAEVKRLKWRKFDSRTSRSMNPFKLRFGFESFTIDEIRNIGGLFFVDAITNRQHSEFSPQGYYKERITFLLRLLPGPRFEFVRTENRLFWDRSITSAPLSLSNSHLQFDLVVRFREIPITRTISQSFFCPEVMRKLTEGV